MTDQLDRRLRDFAEAVEAAARPLLMAAPEHGGLYDHVPPPKACAPDAIAPMLSPGQVPGNFDNYGFRVPIELEFLAVWRP